MFNQLLIKQAKYLQQVAQSNPGHSAKFLADAKIDYEDFTDIVAFNEAVVDAISDITNEFGITL